MGPHPTPRTRTTVTDDAVSCGAMACAVDRTGTKSVGTGWYAASEVLDVDSVALYTAAVDVFSLGVTLAELLLRLEWPGRDAAVHGAGGDTGAGAGAGAGAGTGAGAGAGSHPATSFANRTDMLAAAGTGVCCWCPRLCSL